MYDIIQFQHDLPLIVSYFVSVSVVETTEPGPPVNLQAKEILQLIFLTIFKAASKIW